MKNLATVIGKSEDELKNTVGKLEELCGFPSEDVRLLAENKTKLNSKLAQLGLDPADTTGPELYHALLAKYAQDVVAVDRSLGITADTTLQQKVAKVEDLLKHTLRLRQVWVVKNMAARSILKSSPPKKLMKVLSYRSVDSLLKREDIATTILGAELVESASWKKTFESKMSKLSSTSFELKLPKIVKLHSKISADENRVIVSQWAGAVALSSAEGMPSLTMALLLMDGLERLGEQQDPQDLSPAHVALHFWSDAEHLIFDAEGQPVSLNFKDVATNHLRAKDYGEHINQNGHQQLWAQLMNRYKRYVDELPAEVASVEQKAAAKVRPELALEPIEIYE